jgi:ligand-binding sensor domain-containing protein
MGETNGNGGAEGTGRTGEKSLLRRSLRRAPARSDVRDLMRRFLDEDEQNQALEWDAVTKADGLPHLWIYDLFEDADGRVWVGTWGGGLALWEQGRWKVFDRRHGLASDRVTCVRQDTRGDIWAATDAGLNRFDGTRFVDAGLTGMSILNICFDRDGGLWAGCWRATRSGGGLHRFDGQRWRSFTQRDGLPSLEILKVFEDSRGHIWVGTYEHGRGAGVGRWDGSSWQRFNRKDGLADNCVYSMFEDPDGRMWFGTLKGISVYGDGGWHRMTTMDGLVNDRVYAMFIDADKKMWFGTEGGVSRYDGTSWESFTRGNGLVENLVRAIVQDREGTLWFGTYPYAAGKGGISRARTPTSHESIAEATRHYLQPGRRGQLPPSPGR